MTTNTTKKVQNSKPKKYEIHYNLINIRFKMFKILILKIDEM